MERIRIFHIHSQHYPSSDKTRISGRYLGSGDQLRDFIYIDDAVDAVFSSLPHMNPGQALNLGSGIGVSLKQLAQLACGIKGSQRRSSVILQNRKGFRQGRDFQRIIAYSRPQTSLEKGIEIVNRYQCFGTT